MFARCWRGVTCWQDTRSSGTERQARRYLAHLTAGAGAYSNRKTLAGLSRRRGGAAVDAHLAALQHQLDSLRLEQQLDVRERVAVDDHQVREATRLDRAEVAIEPETLRRPLRRCPERLHRLEPRLYEVAELERVLRVAVAAGVRAGGDRHAQLERALDRGDMMLIERERAGSHVRRGALAMIYVDGERRHEERAVRGHLRHELGLLVEIAAVLDGVDSGSERRAEPGTAERVAHHVAAERMCLADQRAHLLEGERRVLGSVAAARAGTAGRRGLDDVGAGSGHRAHDVAHGIRPIGDAFREERIEGPATIVARRAHAIADAARRGDD